MLGRELVLAFHQWMLDYASDGRRQGYPFDPYLLYFHRRVVRAAAALERLLGEPAVRQAAPQVLGNLSQMLRDYLGDRRGDCRRPTSSSKPGSCSPACERRCGFRPKEKVLSTIRTCWRRKTGSMVQQSLEVLREECRSKAEDPTEPRAAKQCSDRRGASGPLLGRCCSTRTRRNVRRMLWKATGARGNECCRKRHGRKKLTRDFQCLPPEIMLVPNLENPCYLERMLGDLSELQAKLAQAGQAAPPWTLWRSCQKPLNTGRLPRRLLRGENLIDKLLVIYGHHCRPADPQAA